MVTALYFDTVHPTPTRMDGWACQLWRVNTAGVSVSRARRSSSALWPSQLCAREELPSAPPCQTDWSSPPCLSLRSHGPTGPGQAITTGLWGTLFPPVGRVTLVAASVLGDNVPADVSVLGCLEVKASAVGYCRCRN